MDALLSAVASAHTAMPAHISGSVSHSTTAAKSATKDTLQAANRKHWPDC